MRAVTIGITSAVIAALVSRYRGFRHLGTFPRRATSPPLQRRIECHRQQAADGHLHRPRWRGLVSTRSVHRHRRHASAGKLVKEGASGTLPTIHPPLSPLIWTTMLTGVSPLEHRILDFLSESRQWNTRADHQRRTAKPCGVEHGGVAGSGPPRSVSGRPIPPRPSMA